ncbi:MAG: hypothetical protein AVDCRST_MAG59-2091, partial [uncultured Thermomicrobiales bacterium]
VLRVWPGRVDTSGRQSDPCPVAATRACRRVPGGHGRGGSRFPGPRRPCRLRLQREDQGRHPVRPGDAPGGRDRAVGGGRPLAVERAALLGRPLRLDLRLPGRPCAGHRHRSAGARRRPHPADGRRRPGPQPGADRGPHGGLGERCRRRRADGPRPCLRRGGSGGENGRLPL